MNIKKTLISLLVCFSLVFSGNCLIFADVIDKEPDVVGTESSEVWPSDSFSNDYMHAVDENGDITELNLADIENDNAGIAMFATGPMVVNFATKLSTQNTEYKEYGTGFEGYLNGRYAPDGAYLGTENGYVKFMVGGVVGLVPAGEVQVVTVAGTTTLSCYKNVNGRLYHYIATSLYESSYENALDNGNAPSYLVQGETYYSYDGHYFYTGDQYANMLADYNAGNRSHSVNPNDPYYNYFQFLPLRSISSYSESALTAAINNKAASYSSSLMKNKGQAFVNCQNTYGVNALLVAGIAANESGWGSSSIAKNNNNIFGIGAIDATPGQSAKYFPSVEQCIKDFTETYMSKRYCRPGYMHYNGAFLGNKASGANVKYASDPYWGEKAAAVAWGLDRSNGNYDAYKYTIGIKDVISTNHTTLNVRCEASTSSNIAYTTKSCASMAFLILNNARQNGFYQIQSEGVLSADRTSIRSDIGNYSIDNMYLYLDANYLTIVNEGENVKENTAPGPDSEVIYDTHVSYVGWTSPVADGTTSGVLNQARNTVEAFTVSINNIENLGVTYSAYVSAKGWQAEVSDGEMAGTAGETLPIEALKVQLTGEKAAEYDVYYRSYVRSLGWLGWASNGSASGSSGYGYPVEGIQIKLTKKGEAAPGSTENSYAEKIYVGDPNILYESHVAYMGWKGIVSNGETAGVPGSGRAIEALCIGVDNAAGLGVSYRAHVSYVGWQNAVSDGNVAGTVGQSKPIEALQIWLTGEKAEQYDIYYRTYSRLFGWQGWAANGQSAGSEAYSAPIEGIQIKLLPKGSEEAPELGNSFDKKRLIMQQGHVSYVGWQSESEIGTIIGIPGSGKNLEAFRLYTNWGEELGIAYSAHVSYVGWMDEVADGEIAGTVGKSKPIEAVTIRFTGAQAEKYDLYYQSYVKNIGWLDWAKNGEVSGTYGLSRSIEALNIVMVEKGSAAPGDTGMPSLSQVDVDYSSHVSYKGWTESVTNGETSGVINNSRQIEALTVNVSGVGELGVAYSTHVSYVGWTDFVSDGAESGTTGQEKAVEAIKVQLTGNAAAYYDIWYRTYNTDYGWLGWAKNGAIAGTTGMSIPVEGIQMVVLPKNDVAPGSTQMAHLDGNETYLWPCPSSYYITSYFGYRPTPTAGASTYHQGIDIGASAGSQILACKSGTVTESAYNSIRGNFVEVTHADGVKTIYMHMSSRAVSVGTSVARGQVLGYVGSTGVVTGPHLHLSVVVNGVNVNPLNYLKY